MRTTTIFFAALNVFIKPNRVEVSIRQKLLRDKKLSNKLLLKSY